MTDEGEEESERNGTTVETGNTRENTKSAEEGAEPADDEGNAIDPEDFPTLGLTLEEARRHYDDEEQRRTAVENKIGIVVTVDTLLISFSSLFGQNFHPLLLVVVMAPALVSAGLGLWAIRSRDYDRPGKHIEDLYDYSEFDDSDSQREQLLLDYVTTTATNKEKNDPKFTYFNWCIALTFTSLVLVLMMPIAQYFDVDDWLVELGAGTVDYLRD